MHHSLISEQNQTVNTEKVSFFVTIQRKKVKNNVDPKTGQYVKGEMTTYLQSCRAIAGMCTDVDLRLPITGPGDISTLACSAVAIVIGCRLPA